MSVEENIRHFFWEKINEDVDVVALVLRGGSCCQQDLQQGYLCVCVFVCVCVCVCM